MIENKEQNRERHVPIDLTGPLSDNYLGNPNVVQSIVRLFLKDAIEARLAMKDAVDGKAKLKQWVKDRTTADADILLGQHPADYAPVPGWNSLDGGIADQVRRRFGFSGGTPNEAVRTGLIQILTSLAQAEQEDAEGREWKYVIDAGVELLVATLCGFDVQMFGPA